MWRCTSAASPSATSTASCPTWRKASSPASACTPTSSASTPCWKSCGRRTPLAEADGKRRTAHGHAPERPEARTAFLRIRSRLEFRYIVIYICLVKHFHRDGASRRHAHPEDLADRRHGGHHHHRHHG